MIGNWEYSVKNRTMRLLRTALLLAAMLIAVSVCFAAPAHASVKTLKIYADKDIYQDNDGLHDNWDTTKTLYVGNNGDAYGYSNTALGFNLAGTLDGLNISSIKLCFYSYWAYNSPVLSVHRSSDDSWPQVEPTRFPESTGDAIISETVSIYNEWYRSSTDIQSIIKSEYSGDQYITLVLDSFTSPPVCLTLYSCESSMKPYLEVIYTEPTTTISTTASITETNLNGMEVTVTVADDSFKTSALTTGMFALNSEAAESGVSIGAVTYIDSTHARLTLGCTTDIDEHFSLNVRINESALTSGMPCQSNSLLVHVYDEITQAGTYDLDDMGVEADIVVSTTGHVKLIQTSTAAKTKYQITCLTSGADLEIDGINISNSGSVGVYGISFTGVDNKLTLTDNSYIYTQNAPAVVVESGTALTIDGTGMLYADVTSQAAAIGSRSGQTLGAITIDGATVYVYGGSDAAGIGGGQDGSGGSVTVNGGTITAYGGDDGAGIGSGSGASAGINAISIVGGTVTAKGGSGDGAGIGGGEFSAVGTISISGGTVTAGYGGGVGIGCGKSGTVNEISISGGVVYAKNGSTSDAGIGGDEYAVCSAINITGGRVYAEGNATYANDIGYGRYGSDADGTLQVNIGGSSIVFLKNNRLSDRNDGISTSFYDTETITDHVAYDIPVPDSWSGTAYAYISDSVPVTGVSLSPESARLNASTGETLSLSVTVLPAYASDRSVAYQSSNESAAAVDAAGVVTCTGSGTATITVTTTDGGYTDTCVITGYTGVSSVTLSPELQTLILGDADTGNDSAALTATVLPSNADDRSVAYESSDTSVAAVSAAGIVTAVKAGTATITVTTTDGGLTDTCVITVEQRVTGVSVSPTTATLVLDDGDATNDTVSLTPAVTPSDATNKAVSYASSDPNIATVSQAGVVTAIKTGTATITVTTEDGGFTAACAVTVDQKVTGITVSPSSGTLVLGDADTANDTLTLTAAVSPDDADEQGITFASSATGVATVSATGVVTAVKAGTATITATSTDGGYTDTCAITVEQRVTGVSVAPDTAVLVLGDAETGNDTVTLTPTVTPSDATNQTVSYASSDTDVATVSVSGIVTAVKAGTATITLTTADGGFTATCAVTVSQRATGVAVSPTAATLVVGDEDTDNDTVTLTAAVSPEDADVQDVLYASSDPDVATVDAFGIVTAVQKGTAVITVTTVDGSYTATCDITVEHRVRLVPSSSDGRVCMGCSITLTPSVDGGYWEFDSAYLSRSGNVFTPLKTGTSIVTYTVDAGLVAKRSPLQRLADLLITSAFAGEDDTASFSVTAEMLTLTPSINSGTVQTKQTVTLTPNFAGGSWTFDSKYLTRDENTFTARQEGTTTITYTYESQTADYALTIFDMPQTSDNAVSPPLLAAIALLSALLIGAGIKLRKYLLRG